MRRNLSSKTHMVFRQEESARLLHSLKNYCWYFEGHAIQRIKTEGLGSMVSLLVSREFVWTFGFTDDKLEKLLEVVNEKRKIANALVLKQQFQ